MFAFWLDYIQNKNFHLIKNFSPRFLSICRLDIWYPAGYLVSGWISSIRLDIWYPASKKTEYLAKSLAGVSA